MNAYDLIVIGAGPGGYEAAFEGADLGMRTALIERDFPGGTCLNRGCIPTKALLHGAGMLRMLREEAPAFGIDAGEVSLDLARLRERKNEAVLTLRRGIESTAARKKIALIRGEGTVAGPGQVTVTCGEGTQVLTAPYILLATGSSAFVPPIPGIDLEGVVTSDALLEADRIPEKLVIIGGGVIGAEMASLYRALGSDVTILEAMPRLLPGLDREIAQSLKMLFKKRGILTVTGARVEEIRRRADGGLTCMYNGTLSEDAHTVLVSIGRRPETRGLFGAGFEPEIDRGRIVTDAFGRTSLPGVYAAGDVTGGAMLAHAASAAGRNAVRHMAGLAPCADTRFIPSCVYTEPEIACVGLTQDAAAAEGIDAASRKVTMSANGKTVLTGAERGYIRVVYEKETEKLLGVQMMCERASDIIGEAVLALTAGMTLAEAARAVRPHPTFAEALTGALRGE